MKYFLLLGSVIGIFLTGNLYATRVPKDELMKLPIEIRHRIIDNSKNEILLKLSQTNQGYKRHAERAFRKMSAVVKASQLDEENIKFLKKYGDLKIEVDATDDKTVKKIGKLENLRVLDLWKKQLNNRGFSFIGNIAKLERLHLGDTQVNKEGLAHLQLEKLKDLSLWRSGIGNKELAIIKKFKNLKKLNLAYNNKVSNEGIKHLKNLANLTELNLMGTGVSNKVVQDLRKHKSLKRLNLRMTKVTAAGVEKLKRALPNVEISQ